MAPVQVTEGVEIAHTGGASCGGHTRGVAGYGVQMRGAGGPAHSAVCRQPCHTHQVDEESVASDGNHVIKAGCCHHGDRNCCSQGVGVQVASLSKSRWISQELRRSSQLAGDHHTCILHSC